MENKNKIISVYVSPSEYNQIKQEADDYELTISNYIRAVLKLPQVKRGAPIDNDNRRGKKLKAKQIE